MTELCFRAKVHQSNIDVTRVKVSPCCRGDYSYRRQQLQGSQQPETDSCKESSLCYLGWKDPWQNCWQIVEPEESALYFFSWQVVCLGSFVWSIILRDYKVGGQSEYFCCKTKNFNKRVSLLSANFIVHDVSTRRPTLLVERKPARMSWRTKASFIYFSEWENEIKTEQTQKKEEFKSRPNLLDELAKRKSFLSALAMWFIVTNADGITCVVHTDITHINLCTHTCTDEHPEIHTMNHQYSSIIQVQTTKWLYKENIMTDCEREKKV